MWQMLFYVTPLAVGLVLVALVVGAFYLARSELRSATGLPRGLIAGCTLLFLLFIAAPLGQWDQVGTHTRDLDWDPVADIGAAFAAPGPHEPSPAGPNGDRLDQYTSQKPPAGEGAEFHGLHGTAFFLHGDSGKIEVVDPERNDAFDNLFRVLLFVPVGILAHYAFTQCWARLSFGPALSVGIQSIQWAMAAGHTADTADVMLNTAGSLAGTVIAVLCLRAAHRSHTDTPDRSPPPVHPAVERAPVPPGAQALRRGDHNGY
ncbi:VanZ family protein [Nocardiopsis xinjiangensis]|uniref:VanZ family protein n=1 Tax=Nocardiopsis xinjiangensis TaxID=124285 RepID=UPI00035D8CAA|nr:VanZ family protein [Nocardiopsis xinjiangensis]